VAVNDCIMPLRRKFHGKGHGIIDVSDASSCLLAPDSRFY
jgi:hypothetical protein